jgi:hypothetical protein
MRRLMIEVDCGKKRCKRCAELSEDSFCYYCDVWSEQLGMNDYSRPLRCQECLDAEKAAGIGIVKSLSFDGAEVRTP